MIRRSSRGKRRVTALVTTCLSALATMGAVAPSAGATGAVQVTAGSYHFCVLLADGSVKCWGGVKNWYNQEVPLGDGTSHGSTTPVKVRNLSGRVVQVASGAYHNCALIEDGTVQCWGLNGSGQLGDGTTNDSVYPVTVAGLGQSATQISAYGSTSCALLADHTKVCWGDMYGTAPRHPTNWAKHPEWWNGPWNSLSCADPARENTNDCGQWEQSAANNLYKSIAPRGDCGVLLDGVTVQCINTWGRSAFIGSLAATRFIVPSEIKGADTDSGTAGCLLYVAGGVKCLGQTGSGSLGTGIISTDVGMTLTTPFGLGSSVTAVTGGFGRFCAVDGGSVKCWGMIPGTRDHPAGYPGSWCVGPNSNGNATYNCSEFPYAISGLVGTATAVASNNWPTWGLWDQGTCAIVRNGEVQCWGPNTEGELGNGTTTNPSSTLAPQTPIAGISSLIPDISSSVGSPTRTRSATVTLKSLADASFECSLDSRPFQGCASPYSTGNLTDGSHTLQVRAIKDGVTSDAATTTWTVDTARPSQPTFTSQPNALSGSSSALIGWVGAESGGTFECSTDNGFAWTACVSPKFLGGLGSGPMSLKVRQIDDAGNVGIPNTVSWTVDLEAPAAPTLSGQPSPVTNETSASIGWTGAEAGGSFECSVDHAAYTSCTSPLTLTDVAVGDHEVWVRQVDAAGNNGAESIVNWMVVPTGGNVPSFQSGPGGYVNTASVGTTFSASGASAYLCSVDGGQYMACSSPFTTGALADGSHTLSVKAAYDLTVSTAASVSWTSDTVAPDAPTFTAKPAAATSSATADFTISSEAGSTLSCSTNGGTVWTSCSANKSLTGLAEGSYTLKVKQTDRAGNTSPITTYAWVVDRTAPSAPTVTSGPTGVIGTASTSFAFSGESGATFTCSVDGGSYASCSSPKALTGLSEGAHSLAVKQTDAAGNTGVAVTRSYTVDTTLPTAPSVSGLPSGPTNQKSASVTITGGAGQTFQCSVDGGAYASCTSPKAIAGLADGSHSISVKATNALGNSGPAATATWTIDSVAPSAPVIGTKPASLTKLTVATFSVTGESGATFQCSLDGGAYSSCSGTPSLTGLRDGAHLFAVRQVDRAGNQSSAASATWTVDTTPPAAVTFTAKPTTFVNVATATLTWAKQPTGVTVTCGVDGALPSACASPKKLTGLIEGQHIINVITSDAAGNTATATYTWTIDLIAPTLASGVAGGKIVSGSNTILALDPYPDTSGIAKVEWNTSTKAPATTAKPTASKVVSYANPMTIASKTITWLRLQDNAGNWSKWYMAK